MGRPGIDTDVRRRWNSDRGLPARVNLPEGFVDEFDRLLAEMEKLPDAQPLFELVDASKPGRSATTWAQYLYDDLCDQPSDPTLTGVDVRRLARRVFAEDRVDELVSTGEAERVFQFIQGLIELAADNINSDFATKYFGAAIGQTRLGVLDPDAGQS